MALVDDRTIRRSTAEGMIDIPALLKAATHAEWLIVELDRCATDMAEAVAKRSDSRLQQSQKVPEHGWGEVPPRLRTGESATNGPFRRKYR